jgi:hypothetical protein
MVGGDADYAILIEAATTTELRHFALGAKLATKITRAGGLSNRERGEVAETLVAWKSADRALADYNTRLRDASDDGHLIVRTPEPTSE